MADRITERRWLEQLTAIPTAPGRERRVLDWIRAWVARRDDLKLRRDGHGNLLITQKGRKNREPVVAVAHTDHPGFVVTGVEGKRAMVEFRGGVRREYFADARVEIFDGEDQAHRGTLQEFDHDASTGVVALLRTGALVPGDIGRWSFGRTRQKRADDVVAAPACDDLAGVAAALSALDRARRSPRHRHFGVLLTRAEEMGFVGAIGAARDGTLTRGARVFSIECSRAFPESPLRGGPVVRVGDAASVFDHRLTNLISAAAADAGVEHQRRLMAGGSCEATAFVAYGYAATGLCLPLANYHNMGNLDEVEQGRGSPALLPEMVSTEDFHGLVDLLLLATLAVDGDWDVVDRLDRRFEEQRHLLG